MSYIVKLVSIIQTSSSYHTLFPFKENGRTSIGLRRRKIKNLKNNWTNILRGMRRFCGRKCWTENKNMNSWNALIRFTMKRLIQNWVIQPALSARTSLLTVKIFTCLNVNQISSTSTTVNASKIIFCHILMESTALSAEHLSDIEIYLENLL